MLQLYKYPQSDTWIFILRIFNATFTRLGKINIEK